MEGLRLFVGRYLMLLLSIKVIMVKVHGLMAMLVFQCSGCGCTIIADARRAGRMKVRHGCQTKILFILPLFMHILPRKKAEKDPAKHGGKT